MSQRHELNDFQKGEILALEPHFSYAEIERQLGIPRSTIRNFIYYVKNCQSIDNLPHSGQPRKMSRTADWWLICNAESELHLLLKVLKNISNIDISKRTLLR